MKYFIIVFFLLNSLKLFSQESIKGRMYFSMELAGEIGIKKYGGVRQTKHYNNDPYVGGGLRIGVVVGRMLSERFQLRGGVYGQRASRGIFGGDTTLVFSKLNVNTALRYYMYIKTKGKITKARCYAEAGVLFGVLANWKEESILWNSNYAAKIRYKPALGPTVETGVELFVSSHFSVDMGLRFHYINYSAMTYSENGNTLSVDQLSSGQNLKRIEGSGGGCYGTLKYWF